MLSGDGLGATEAFNHGDAQQIGVKFFGAGDDAAQFVVEVLALDRVFLLDVAFVLNGLALQILLRNRPPLTIVEIEQVVAGVLENDFGKFVDDVEGVVQAEIHAHAAKRIVDMRRVARNHEAAIAITRGDTLMHVI